MLIKLITNAIKFTRLEPKRLIAVSIGACAKQPERSLDGIKYILTKVADKDARLQDDWRRGKNIFLQF